MNSGQQIQPRILPIQNVNEHRQSQDLHRFIYEIAKGMGYLHSQNVHHGDLKVILSVNHAPNYWRPNV